VNTPKRIKSLPFNKNPKKRFDTMEIISYLCINKKKFFEKIVVMKK
jgi:hypothetical protein